MAGIESYCNSAQNKRKPLVIMKVGHSSGGKKAGLIHTGLSTGDAPVYDRIFEGYGIISVQDLEDLFGTAQAFCTVKKFPEEPRVALVTTSGEAGVFISDQCPEVGLKIPKLNQKG